MNFYVEIYEDESGIVEKRMDPMSKWAAERVEDGAGINLDWNRFSTRIVEEEANQERGMESPIQNCEEEST